MRIGAVYGCFDRAIWNGGRVLNNEYSDDDIKICALRHRERQIPIRFTYTNSLIKPLHLENSFCNWTMQFADEIIVNSDLLEQYIRENYSWCKIISSTTKCILEPEEIKKECDKYALVVLDYRQNRNFKLLEELPKDKIEILLNPVCPLDCGRRLQHYESLSQLQLTNYDDGFDCEIMHSEGFLENLANNKAVISKEELYNYYIPNGFSHFKIEGRTEHIVDIIESYVYYMVKEEYKDHVRNLLFKAII